MKKILFVVGVISVAVLAFAVVGFAYAQTQTPPYPEYPYGPGMMGNDKDSGRAYGHANGFLGMGWDSKVGPMHTAMVAALAEALDIPAEEIEARHDAGETIWEIAQAGGLSTEEIQDLMLSTHDIARDDAVANGWMTAEQAEWMDAHMEQMWSGDYQDGAFGGHCGGRGWTSLRWQADN